MPQILEIAKRTFRMGIITYATGSMADMPKDLQNQIKKLEELFIVDADKLKEITNHFISELERGLREDATIVSLMHVPELS